RLRNARRARLGPTLVLRSGPVGSLPVAPRAFARTSADGDALLGGIGIFFCRRLNPFYIPDKIKPFFCLSKRDYSNWRISAEPNLSATSFLRLLVNGRQASIPQNGQYLRNKDTLCGRSGLGYSPRMPRRRWFGSTFSDSLARDELLVNGHKAIRVGSGAG